MTAADAGFLASLPSLIGVVGSIALNRMAVRLNSKKPLILTLLAVTGVGIYLMGTSTGLILWVSLIVYGFCSGALTPLMMLVLMDNRDVGKELMGAAGGLYFTIGEIGGFSGPFLMGYVKDYTGSFLFGIILLAVFVEIMLIPAFILKERKSTSEN
jgi:cyanate permease